MSSDATPITPARFAAALKDLSAENLALKVFELRNSIAHLDYSNAELRPYAEGLVSVMSHNDNTNNTTTGPSTTTPSSTTTTTTTPTTPTTSINTNANANQEQEQEQKGDQDCIDAIAENEVVIARMQERIELIRAEVETRGLSWDELSGRLPSSESTDDDGHAPSTVGVVLGTSQPAAAAAAAAAVNGNTTTTSATTTTTNGTSSASLQNGTANGNGQHEQQRHEAWRDGTFQTGTIRLADGGAGLSDEELLRRLQAQIPGLGGDDDGDDDGDDGQGGMHL